MRAISTVLDVAVFMVLVSAAVGTVAYAPTPVESGIDAQSTASLLASTTATVDYEIRGADRQGHGTLGTLLARGAVANTSVAGQQVTGLADDFRATVRSRVRETLRNPNTTQVTAVWQPYRDAPVHGRIGVGATPPPGVDVAAVTVSVPAPFDSTETANLARLSGYRGLAEHVARPITAALLPSTASGASAGQQNPTAVVSSRRYRAIADSLGVSVEAALTRGDVADAHETVTEALAQRIEADIRGRFVSPAQARQALQTGTVTITVRRWDV